MSFHRARVENAATITLALPLVIVCFAAMVSYINLSEESALPITLRMIVRAVPWVVLEATLLYWWSPFLWLPAILPIVLSRLPSWLRLFIAITGGLISGAMFYHLYGYRAFII